MSKADLLRVLLVLICLVQVSAQGTGSIVYASKKGLYAVLVDGSQQVRTIYEYPAGEVHEDVCGLVVDSQAGLVLWAETVEQPVMEAILWRISLNPAGGETPVRVAAYTSSAARVYGLTIDEGSKSAYMTYFMSVGVEMFKLENYDTATDVAMSKGTHTYSGRRVSGPVSGYSPAFANGEVYESGKENGNDYCDVLRVTPGLKPPVALTNPRNLMWQEMCGPIVFSPLDGLLYYAMGDDFNANHLVRSDPLDAKASEELFNVDVPEFLHDRPAVFYVGAPWPNIAPIGDAAGWLATNSVSEIYLWDLTDTSAPVKTTIYQAIPSEGNIGPIVWGGDPPPMTDSPTQQPTSSPTDVPTDAPGNVTESPTMVPAAVNASVTDSPTAAPNTSNVTAVPTAAPNTTNISTPVPLVTTPIPGTPTPGVIVNTLAPVPAPDPGPPPEKDEGVPLGMIIGICAGVILLCILIALILVCYKRKKDKEKMAARQAERDYLLQEARNRSAEKERENKEKAVNLVAVPVEPPKPPTPEPVESEPVESEDEKEIVQDNITVEEVVPIQSPTRNSLRHSLVYWNGSEVSPPPTSRSSVGGFPSESGPEIGSLAHRILRMYEAYNPAKIDTIDTLTAKYGEEALLKTLIDKYGPEPGESGGAMSPHFRSSVARDSTNGSLTSPLLQNHMTD